MIWRALIVSVCLLGGTLAVPQFNVAREPGTRPGSYFYHTEDGYHYHVNNPREELGFMHTRPHEGHERDPLYPDEMALRRNILARCRTMDYVPYRTIIDEECRWFEDDVVRRVTYARMRTPMRNARMSSLPPLPRDLNGLLNVLQNPQYSVLTMTDDGRDNIFGGHVIDRDGGHHVVFVSDRRLDRMRTMRVLHSDGTFRTVPVSPRFSNQANFLHCWCVGWPHCAICMGAYGNKNRSGIITHFPEKMRRTLMRFLDEAKRAFNSVAV